MIAFAFTLQILKFKDLLYNRAGKISKDERLLFPSYLLICKDWEKMVLDNLYKTKILMIIITKSLVFV